MKKLFACSCIILCTACTPFKSSRPPPEIYTLQTGTPCEKNSATTKLLEIAPPEVPSGFETSRIGLYLSGGRRLDYYAGATWPSPLPAFLQDFAVQSGRHMCDGMMTEASAAIPAVYKLKIKVNEFGPVYAATPDTVPDLHVSLTFTLFDMDRKKSIIDFTLSENRVATDNRLTVIVSGLERTLRDILAGAFRRISQQVHAR